MGWVFFKNLEITPCTKSLHCDTRDFHVFKHEEGDFPTSHIDKCSIINETDIIPWLEELHQASGGDVKWRMLSFNDLKTVTSWIKYIRLYRINETQFVVTTSIADKTCMLNVSKMTKSNIKSNDLGAF